MLTENQIKEFIQNPVWREIKETVSERMGSFSAKLEDVTLTHEQDLLAKAGILELRYVLALPDLMLEEINYEKEMRNASGRENESD